MEHEIFREKQLTLKEKELIGTVRSCFRQHYLAKEKKGEITYSTMLSRDTSFFNEKGYLVEKIYYSNGKKSIGKPLEDVITFKVKCEYLEEVHLMKNTTTNKNGKKIIYSLEIEYDEKFRIVKENYFNGEKDGYLSSTEQYSYIYSNEGCKIICLFKSSGREKLTEQFNDLNGRMLYSQEYQENGEVIRHKDNKWIYDDINRTEIMFYYEDNPKSFDRRTYDENGHLLEKLVTKEDGKIYEKATYQYNELGQIKKEVKIHGKGFIDTYEYYYDEHHNLIKSVSKLTYGNQLFATDLLYEYDNFGNWVSQKIYENKKLKEIIERKIEYYL